MFITKKHVSRRTVLKGAGAAIALPLLDAMSPAGVAWGADGRGQDAAPARLRRLPARRRHAPLGRRPRRARDYTMTRILEPLAPYREHMTIVSGLRNKPAESPEPHAYHRAHVAVVRGAEAGRSHRPGCRRHGGPARGAAHRPGNAHPVARAHDVAARRAARVAHADAVVAAGRQSAQRVLSVVRPGRQRSRACRHRPGDGQHPRPRHGAGRRACRRSSAARTARPSASTSTPCARSSAACRWRRQQDTSDLDIPEAPIGVPNDLDTHFALMFDLMALAFQADLTRVITFSMDREASMRTYSNLSISEAFHPLSHHAQRSRQAGPARRDPDVSHEGVRALRRAHGEDAGRRRLAARSLDGAVRQQHERQQSPQQRSVAVGDPGSCARPHQRRPALALRAGLEALESAADAARAHARSRSSRSATATTRCRRSEP